MPLNQWISINPATLAFGNATIWDGGQTTWDNGGTLWDVALISTTNWSAIAAS